MSLATSGCEGSWKAQHAVCRERHRAVGSLLLREPERAQLGVLGGGEKSQLRQESSFALWLVSYCFTGPLRDKESYIAPWIWDISIFETARKRMTDTDLCPFVIWGWEDFTYGSSNVYIRGSPYGPLMTAAAAGVVLRKWRRSGGYGGGEGRG